MSKKITIGYINEVNGAKSIKQQAEISLYEAELLCRHWAERMRGVDECWLSNQTGSYEIRMHPYANSRIAYFMLILGPERVNKIVDEVYEGFDKLEETMESCEEK